MGYRNKGAAEMRKLAEAQPSKLDKEEINKILNMIEYSAEMGRMEMGANWPQHLRTKTVKVLTSLGYDVSSSQYPGEEKIASILIKW